MPCAYCISTYNLSMESQDQVSKIQKTANTIYDLKDHSDVKFCKEIADFLVSKTGNFKETRLSNQDFGALVVSRFITVHGLLEMMAKKYGKKLQIIELGAGFTPHFLNLSHDVGKYVEVDFEFNSKLKKEITQKLTEKKNATFVAGDILSEEVWREIKNNVDVDKPVLIFSVGVVSPYFDSEQKEKLASLVKPFLVSGGSCFVIDDTLRNHPELRSNPIIRDAMDKVVSNSGSIVYHEEACTFSTELDRWSRLINSDVCTVDYILSKPEMDFAVKEFKLIICANDRNKELEPGLLKLSSENRLDRVWK